MEMPNGWYGTRVWCLNLQMRRDELHWIIARWHCVRARKAGRKFANEKMNIVRIHSTGNLFKTELWKLLCVQSVNN